jgi:hypothetical protein
MRAFMAALSGTALIVSILGAANGYSAPYWVLAIWVARGFIADLRIWSDGDV